jgi:hypothetical protein
MAGYNRLPLNMSYSLIRVITFLEHAHGIMKAMSDKNPFFWVNGHPGMGKPSGTVSDIRQHHSRFCAFSFLATGPTPQKGEGIRSFGPLKFSLLKTTRLFSKT